MISLNKNSEKILRFINIHVTLLKKNKIQLEHTNSEMKVTGDIMLSLLSNIENEAKGVSTLMNILSAKDFKKLKIEQRLAKEIIIDLIEKKFINGTITNNGFDIEEIFPTYSGKTYFELKRKYNKRILFNSFLFPLFVALVATIIINLVFPK